jgi:DNA-binding Xre family transcriptional regulator
MENKTVAEKLREIANGKRQYPGCELLVSVATGSARCRQDANTCAECKGKNLKDLADMIGLCPSTLNARLNNPEQMRLWELQKLSEVIEKTEKETGKIWKPKGGAVSFEGIV